MGGFLGALAPIGQTLSGAFQVGQIRQQQQANRDAFGKALENLGPDPEYDMMRQMFKAGASPEAITNVLGGPIGKALQQEYKDKRWADFVGPGGMEGLTPNKVWEGVGRGLIHHEDALKFQEDWTKNQLAAAKLRQATGFKTSPKLGDFLTMYGLTPEDWDAMPKEQKQAMLPAFQDFERKAGGSGDTVLKPIFSPPGHPGKTMWEYVPKSAAAGTFAGEIRPPATGANPAGEMAATEDSLKQLGQTIDDAGLGDSTSPMTMTELQLKAKGWLGIPDPTERTILGQISLLNYTLTGIALKGWGSRNPQYANELINYHIPQPGEPPVVIKQKINDWMKPGGFLDKYRKTLGLPVPGEAGGMGGGGEMPSGGGAPSGEDAENADLINRARVD